MTVLSRFVALSSDICDHLSFECHHLNNREKNKFTTSTNQRSLTRFLTKSRYQYGIFGGRIANVSPAKRP